MHHRPNVLVISGLDPSGGAGLQADIQAITALGAHPLPVLSCLTVQDTRNVYASQAVDPALLRHQLQVLLKDMPIAAIKTGALGNAALVDVILDVLADVDCPWVVDPVLVATGGGALADDALREAFRERLIPRACLVTPNDPELAALGGCADLEENVATLRARGCQAVLVTGGHGTGPDVINRLFDAQSCHDWAFPRLPGEFHGSGCTLAAAIAAGLAHGHSLTDAISQAQRFVASSLRNAWPPGHGYPIPDRTYR